MKLKEILNNRILLMDGAMGTMIQKHSLNEEDFRGERFRNHNVLLKGNNDLLSITKPDIIYDIHCQYFNAGSDIIETNTFNSNSISQEDYKLSNLVYELNYESAKLARKAADYFSKLTPEKPRFVAGSIGPTNQTTSMSPDINDPSYRKVNFDIMKASYNEQIIALIEGGVDIILLETITDTLNAKAAILALTEARKSLQKETPLMISGTVIDKSGRTLSGQTIKAFLTSISHAENLLSVGLNCSLGSEQIRPFIKELSENSIYYTSLYPNAGLPNEFGEYDESPEFMASQFHDFIKEGFVNIIGGCCGTTPEHIKAFDEVVKGALPRKNIEKDKLLRLAGLEYFELNENTNFVNIGERTNVAGSSRFKSLIINNDYEIALSIAKQQVENGAQIIDINMDEGMLDSEEAMVKFLNFLASEPDIAKVPLMIDSSKWTVIEEGLKCVQGKAIVNSISLKEGKDEFIKQEIGRAHV